MTRGQVPLDEPAAISNAHAYQAYKDDSLFEHATWLYAFCREHLFRDDTNRIITALWPEGRPAPGTTLIELGCGPGFYSCRLGARFREMLVTGVDRSAKQVQWASARADALHLTNCSFKRINALRLSSPEAAFDVVLASRLFTILPEQAGVIAEMYRVLKPGGRCLVAEPRYAFWASIPLFAMRLLAGLSQSQNGYREPRKATVFSAEAFANLFPAQPWKKIKTWQDGRYQYALCQKG
ncbi:MAG TPA: class I SAM-dependent methyltransferase [Candidatus Udaeobacter sp.]|nr:class I SAM-dependent methyltransferase [Candidatus Udaeobacter sp.]